jgi:hypothetical protein
MSASESSPEPHHDVALAPHSRYNQPHRLPQSVDRQTGNSGLIRLAPNGLSTMSFVPQLFGGIPMAKSIRSQNLTSGKIVDLLAKADIHVTDDQAVAIERFVRDTGGLDQARSAVETLGQLITAA